MINPAHTHSIATMRKNPLLKNIQMPLHQKGLKGKTNSSINRLSRVGVKVCLESIHYTGKNYGYGWTFVISLLNKHWISHRVQIKRGAKSPVNKDVYNDIKITTLDELKNLDISICAQHRSGFKVDTILRLHPNSFKENMMSKSIYTNVEMDKKDYHFHEIQTVNHDNAQLMFVFKFEITPIDMH